MPLNSSNLLSGLFSLIVMAIATGCASNPQSSSGDGLVKGSAA